MKNRFLLLFLILCFPIVAVSQDYENALSLRSRVEGKVYLDRIEPQWQKDNERFWYRRDLPGDKREFILIHARDAKRTPAFDHARLAKLFSEQLNQTIEPDRLPIDRLRWESDGAILIQTQTQTFRYDPRANRLEEAQVTIESAKASHPRDLPDRTIDTGERVYALFVNQTDQVVKIYWLDFEGRRVEYGVLQPGEQKRQGTFSSHIWLVTDTEEKPLAGFRAPDLPSTLLIQKPFPEPEPPRPAPALSPDGRHRILFRNNQAVLRNVETGQETALTTDGNSQSEYRSPVLWSPDSRSVVFFKWEIGDDRKVHIVQSSPRDQLQPKLITLDYPKPGDKIDVPTPVLYDLDKGVRSIENSLFPDPWRIWDIQWEPDNKRFSFLYMKRGFQKACLIEVDAETAQTRAVIDETTSTFVDWTNKTYLYRVPGKREAIWMSERSGWNHLYLYDMNTGKVKNAITSGEWVVRGIDHIDPEARQIWFRASGIDPDQDPYHVHYCRVNFDGTGFTRLTRSDGTHRARYSPDRKYLIATLSRADQPPITELRRCSDGKLLLTLETADDSELKATGWRYPTRFHAKGRDGKTEIYGLIHFPTQFDPEKKYPVIEAIYAGPQGAHVPKAFETYSSARQFAELGFIVVQIDGMGTNFRSKAFHDVCWQNLADAGFPDRIAWMKAAAQRFPQMDLSRVGIYGTSAGGQNALHAMLLHGDFYKSAVVDCGCYDNRMDKMWWNEQWMGYPIGKHYEEQSCVTLAPNLKGSLLILLGEIDSNVDPASTMQVVNALIRANKPFEMLTMPGVGHGTLGHPYALRRAMEFFVRNLK